MAYNQPQHSSYNSYPNQLSSPGPTHHLPPPPPLSEQPSQSHFADLTLDNTLEDLCARFIVNLPSEELESMDRVCFQIEQA